MTTPIELALTEEELYNFDTAGWLHVRGVLSTAEQAAAAHALDSDGAADAVAQDLLHHPSLKLRLAQLFTSANSSDVDRAIRDDGTFSLKLGGHAALLPRSEEEVLAGGPGDGGILDMGRSYLNAGGHRYIHGLTVVWAVAAGRATGGYTVVSASHKATMPVPAAMRRPAADGGNEAPFRNLGLLQQPPLAAGDVLLISSATLHGARHPDAGCAGPRLLRCELLSSRTRPTEAAVPSRPHAPEREAPWMSQLSPLERVVMGLDPQKRKAGDGLPTVRAANGKAWLERSDGGEEEEEQQQEGVRHPSVLMPDPSCSPQHLEEFLLWDMCGYLNLLRLICH